MACDLLIATSVNQMPEKFLPDLSWADPLGKKMLASMDRIHDALLNVNRGIYLEGFWQGAVTAAIVVLVLWAFSRK